MLSELTEIEKLIVKFKAHPTRTIVTCLIFIAILLSGIYLTTYITTKAENAAVPQKPTEGALEKSNTTTSGANSPIINNSGGSVEFNVQTLESSKPDKAGGDK